MNTVDGNVVYLRPAGNAGLRHLALTLGNGARQSEHLLADIGERGAEMSILAQCQTDLAKDAAILSSDLHAIMAQIERCQDLWAEINDVKNETNTM